MAERTEGIGAEDEVEGFREVGLGRRDVICVRGSCRFLDRASFRLLVRMDDIRHEQCLTAMRLDRRETTGSVVSGRTCPELVVPLLAPRLPYPRIAADLDQSTTAWYPDLSVGDTPWIDQTLDLSSSLPVQPWKAPPDFAIISACFS